MSDKKKKECLTYFLDHPQIKRHKSPGNGNSPSTNAKPGFFNQLASGKLRNPSGGSGSQPKQATGSSAPKSTGSNQAAWQKAFSKGFKGE